MHELSVVQSIVRTTEGILEERGIERASYLTLVIGKHTGIIPRYVRMYYADVCEGTRLEGSELRIETKSTEYFCRDCGHVFGGNDNGHEQLHKVQCPECNSDDLEVIAGDELLIKDIGYEN